MIEIKNSPEGEPHYPDLFQAADKASEDAQRLNSRLIIIEYALLIGTALLAMLGTVIKLNSGLYVAMFIGLGGIATAAHIMRPDHKWYHSRAMAESVKSVAWSYMMRAAPFADTDNPVDLRARFAKRLDAILTNSQTLGAPVAPNATSQGQITKDMKHLRALSVAERLSIYLKERVDNQCNWYLAKSETNKRRAFLWYLAIIAIYVLPAIAILGLGDDAVEENWPTYSLFLLLGSCALGWTKAKRFRELAASYALTVQEITILKSTAEDVKNESDISDFVESAERAFSREHTQWVARRS
ncbi:MAG: DUF4231 domain-containing protein [Pseudomonadota bacterium]